MSEARLDGLLVVIWVTLMVSLFAAAAAQYAFYRRLRLTHRAAWQELGSPTLLRYHDYLS
jgi:hypothetical protein